MTHQDRMSYLKDNILNDKFLSRFEKKIKKDPSLDGCWTWTGSKSSGGYGMLSIGYGKNIQATWFSYLYYNGPIFENMQICHKCDNPECVNPNHLFQGTRHENMRDCVKKGRIARKSYPGEKNPNSKLKNKDIIKIRELLDLGFSYKYICYKYKISKTMVYLIKSKRNWRNI